MMPGIISRPEIEHIVIDIKHEDFMKLAYQRELALNSQVLITDESDYVPATIRHNNKSVNVKIRLKGDAVDHLQGDKWSYRIKVKGDDTLFGMKQFSIQHPWTRNYIYEWIYHQALKREGVLSIRYEFITVTLNGEDLGVYALEENFEKRLIEHNQLREGPVVRFNENLVWEQIRQQERPFPYAQVNGSGSFTSSDIDAFQTNDLLLDPLAYAQFVNAKSLLEAFRRGELKTSDVFDVQKLARYYAVTDLMGDEHGNRWTNVRFYYNPITSRLEPIGYDADPGRPLHALSPMKEQWNLFDEIVFRDPVFFAEYVKQLERVSERSYLDALLADLNDDLNRNLRIIYSEFPPFDFNFSKGVLYQNQEYIRTMLEPAKGLQPFYYKATQDQVELQIANIQSLPLEVLNVSYQDTLQFQPVEKVLLLPKVYSEVPDYQKISFRFPDGFFWSDAMRKDLKVNYRILGTSQIRQETVFPWSYLDDNFIDNDFIRQEPNAHAFSFLVIDDLTKEILIKPGIWDLDQSLIIPGGYRVIGREGIQLNLLNSAKILSYSPLELIGSEEYPIVIRSTNVSGQGVIVMNTEQASILNYVIFENLSNPSQSGWELTGSITFYESPVNISHCQFIRNRSEDTLNVVRSEFTVEETLFSDALSDAIDADFSTGTISNSYFLRSGNDAIDASGSNIEIESISIDGTGDKGLSVGEDSQVNATGIEIKNAQIAIASKDMSQFIGENVSLSDSKFGLTVYQKKSEFGPAKMRINGLSMTAVGIPYLIEERSNLIVDNQAVASNEQNVYHSLYGTESSP
jgi:hypothetical protein